MSKEQQVSITCPECKTTHPFTKYDSVNTKIDPELKDAVKYGSLFEFKCPSCGAKTTVNYGILYHQMEDNIMIYYAVSDEDERKTYSMMFGDTPSDPASLMMQKMRKQGHYLMRIVRSQNELREKVMILDDGLDDRIMEIFKTSLALKIQQDNPNCRTADVLYYSNETGSYIQTFVNGKTYNTMKFPHQDYETFRESIRVDLPDIRDDGPFIDRQWALEKLGKRPPSNRTKVTKTAVTATQQTGCLLPILSVLILCALLFVWL